MGRKSKVSTTLNALLMYKVRNIIIGPGNPFQSFPGNPFQSFIE